MEQQQRFWGSASLLGLCVFLASGFSFDSLAIPNMWVVFGLITAAAWVYARQDDAQIRYPYDKRLKMDRPVIVTIIIVALVFLLLCCLCLAVVLVGGVFYSWNVQLPPQTEFSWNSAPSATPVVVRPSPQATLPAEPTLQSDPNSGTVDALPPVQVDGAHETLKTLTDTIVPINDPYSITKRLEGKQDIPPTLDPPVAPFQMGAKKSFWVSNTDTNENFQVPATLRYITDHSYFWIEDGLSYKREGPARPGRDF